MKHTQPLSLGAALAAGWKLTWKNIGFLLLTYLIMLGIGAGIWLLFSAIVFGSGTFADPTSPTPPTAVIIVLSLIAFPSYAGLIIFTNLIALGYRKIIISITDQKERTIRDLFSHWNYFLTYIAGYILYALIIYAGFAFLIVPAFIWGIQYQYALHLILDKDMDVRAAFDRSAQLTKGKRLKLFWYAIVLCLVAFSGALALGIGLLITVPMAYIAWTHIYKQLIGEAKPL